MSQVYKILFFFCFCIGGLIADPISIENFPNVKVLSQTPRIYSIEHFLTADECDHIANVAKEQLARSTVVDEKTGGNSLHPARTSQGMFFPQETTDPILKNIENRIATYTQIPVENGEAIQVLRYGVGGEYKPHYDYFDPAIPGSAPHLSRGGQRVATLIMYLKTTEEGGETIFPRAKIKVTPIKGDAVLFYNCTPNGKEDDLSLHGGVPVISGEKWIATKWLHGKAFR